MTPGRRRPAGPPPSPVCWRGTRRHTLGGLASRLRRSGELPRLHRHGPPGGQVLEGAAFVRRSSSTGERNAARIREHSSAKSSPAATCVRRENARICAGRNGCRDDRLEVVSDRVGCTVATTQEVQIARGAVGSIRPEPKEHRTLEDEAVAAIGGPEAIEKALQAIGREQRLVVVAGYLRAAEQTRSDRRGEVGMAGHAMASR